MHVGFDAFQNQLQPGERILRRGQPNPRKVFIAEDVLLIPFSLVWSGFAIFFSLSVYGLIGHIRWGDGSTKPLFYVLSVFFDLVAVGILFGRFFFKSWTKKHTHYALTNHRVLIARRVLSGRRITSIELSKIATIEMEERGDGTGSIHFGSPGPFLSVSPTPPPTIPKFEDVPQVQAVYRLAKDAHSAI